MILVKLKKNYGSLFRIISAEPNCDSVRLGLKHMIRLFEGEPLQILDTFKAESGDMFAEVLTVGKYSRAIRVHIWENWLESF